MERRIRYHILDFVAYTLMILCFPLNPLVMFKVVDPHYTNILSYVGIFCWMVGMYFVIYPFIYFKLKGNVDKGKSYVYTNTMVTSGLYGIVRHVQYTGGIISIFIATPLLYPHWIFVILGIPGIFLTYLGSRREDQLLIEKFGVEYREYMDKIPAMNIFIGIWRKIKKTKI